LKELDHLADSLLLLCSKTFAPYWTITVLLVESTIFAFMAAEHSRLCLPPVVLTVPLGPRNLLQFFQPNTARPVLHSAYLYKWGAFYLPDSFGSGSFRWFNTALLHSSLPHCAGNLVVYALISAPFELRVGTVDTAVVWVLTALGGTLAHAAFGKPCSHRVLAPQQAAVL
jgi:membrane associated rhomboid family serine protease